MPSFCGTSLCCELVRIYIWFSIRNSGFLSALNLKMVLYMCSTEAIEFAQTRLAPFGKVQKYVEKLEVSLNLVSHSVISVLMYWHITFSVLPIDGRLVLPAAGPNGIAGL